MVNENPTYNELLSENRKLRSLLLEKAEIENSLKENEENFRLMVQHTHEPFFCFNPDETYRFVNDYFAKTLSKTPEEIIGKTPHAIFPFDEAEKRLSIVRKVFKSGNTEEIEVKVVKPDGGEIYFVTIVTPVKDKQNNILWVSCISKNITEQKLRADNNENQLKLNEEKWKLIIKNSTDVLNLINEKGELIFISEAAEKITGYKNDEMYGSLATKIHPDDLKNVERALAEVITNKEKVARIQYRHIHKYNEWVWLEAVGQNFLDHPAIKAIVVNVRDISQIKEKELELIAAKEKAEESDRLKDAFLNNISHEVRTPLNAVMGFSELITSTDQTAENLKLIFKLISDNSNKLIDIITDVIDISQLQTKQIEKTITEFDIILLINELIEIYKPQILTKNLELVYSLNPNLSTFNIITDKTKLYKILKHLIDNAVKFTHKGSITLEISLLNDRINFNISDTGIGISEQMQKLIFDPFIQGENGLCRNYGGNGIGLTIVKGYIKLLEGTIEMQSEDNSGTTFKFSIPIILGTNSSETNNKKAFVNTKMKSILIVEDEKSNYIYLAETLRDFFKNIFYASDGQQAIDICKTEKNIDLILMDIKMPIMDGFTATKLIKAFRPEIPVIAQTAYALETDKIKFLEAGFDNYLCKPISIIELHKTINKYL